MSRIMRFKDNELKKGLINSIARFKERSHKYLYISIDAIGFIFDDYTDELVDGIEYFENIKCTNENYTTEEYDELEFDIEDGEYIITGVEDVKICLDESESTIETTLEELIKLIENVDQASIDDDGICIADNLAILRVIPQNLTFENLDEFPSFEKIISYQNKSVTLTTYFYSDLYYMRVFFDDNFDEYNPVISYDDMFVEINFGGDSDLIKENIIEIFNVYIFEFFVAYGYKMTTNPRNLFTYEADEIDNIDTNILILNPLLFSKGMEDVLILFNGAEGYNDDRAILEYVKVIEYISVTVVNQNVTIDVQKKLNEIKKITPSGDYIKELGDIYINQNRKLKSDSELIKAAIKECCDIENLVKYSPIFIKPLKELKKAIIENVSNKTNLINNANIILAQSISDTRNNISHAKANYENKGYECPDNQKKEFIILLRNVCVQVIRWFYNTDESIRIIKEITEGL